MQHHSRAIDHPSPPIGPDVAPRRWWATWPCAAALPLGASCGVFCKDGEQVVDFKFLYDMKHDFFG